MEILSMIVDLVSKITELLFRMCLISAMLYLTNKMIAEPCSIGIVFIAFFVLLITLLDK